VYILYSCLLFFALLALLPVYVFRKEALRGESLHLGQRLGFVRPRRNPRRRAVWIHAVSVGEVLSLQSLVRRLRARHPSWEIFFSTLTETGYRQAREKLRAVDHLFFVPFDFGWSVRRVLRAVRPSVLVLAESEFWPNLLRQARRHSAAVLLANGRISDRSFGRYRKLKLLTRFLWPNVSRFLVQTAQDKSRLEALGVESRRVEVSGNLKSEVSLQAMTPAAVRRMKARLGLSVKGKVVVAGSTRPGEEEALVKGFAEARRRRDDVCLILAPRHPDRIAEVERICAGAGFAVCRRTEARPGRRWDILVLDTMGELAHFYALGDAAFIGGSLVPWGGHNILEPAYYGKPVFFGPHMHNFSYLAGVFLRAGGAAVVTEGKDLAEVFSFRREKAMKAMGLRAKRTLDSLQGATDRTIEAIEHLMAERGADV